MTTTLKATLVVPEKNLKGDEFQLLEPIYAMGVLVLKPVNVMFKTLQKGTLIHPAKPVDGTSRFESTILKILQSTAAIAWKSAVAADLSACATKKVTPWIDLLPTQDAGSSTPTRTVDGSEIPFPTNHPFGCS